MSLKRFVGLAMFILNSFILIKMNVHHRRLHTLEPLPLEGGGGGVGGNDSQNLYYKKIEKLYPIGQSILTKIILQSIEPFINGHHQD